MTLYENREKEREREREPERTENGGPQKVDFLSTRTPEGRGPEGWALWRLKLLLPKWLGMVVGGLFGTLETFRHFGYSNFFLGRIFVFVTLLSQYLWNFCFHDCTQKLTCTNLVHPRCRRIYIFSGWTLQEVKLLIWTVAFLLEYLGFWCSKRDMCQSYGYLSQAFGRCQNHPKARKPGIWIWAQKLTEWHRYIRKLKQETKPFQNAHFCEISCAWQGGQFRAGVKSYKCHFIGSKAWWSVFVGNQNSQNLNFLGAPSQALCSPTAAQLPKKAKQFQTLCIPPWSWLCCDAACL